MGGALLDQLVGSWDLRGRMATTDLHQTVKGRWVLGDRYVELRFREVDGDPYEAVYYVGWNEERGKTTRSVALRRSR